MAVATIGCLAAVGVGGYQLGHNTGSAPTSPTRLAFAPNTSGQPDPQSDQNSGSGNAARTTDPNAIADQLDDSIVNLTTTLASGGEAAGTGIIVSSSGLVLTNNHVIANSTSLQAENAADGSVHSAKVLGYDVTHDVALVQIQGVSGLIPAPLARSSNLSVGDAVVALGNAGGRGGAPSVAAGTVIALNQQITASDQDGSNAETLGDLIEIDADIQPGDSGGPLADANGRVVGMDAAASTSNGGFGFGGDSANQGYAIPIEDALAIANKISAGEASADVHVGGARAVLGVEVQDDSANAGDSFGNGGTSSGSGAAVLGVQPNSGAESAGISAGDVIIAINGESVSSATELTRAMTAYAPKDTVDVTWTDSSGAVRHDSVQLGSGPPA
jgi:S1-C subfamily serine protease